MSELTDRNRTNNLSTLIIGVIIGASLTYLLTTKKGQKIKDQILEEGKKLLADLAEKAEETQEQLAENKEEIPEKVREVANEVKEEAKQLAEDVPGHIEQIQKKGRRFFFRKDHPQTES